MTKKTIVLTVVGVLALCLFGIPGYLKARGIAQRNACLSNLRQLTAPMTCCVPLSERLSHGDKMEPSHVFQFTRGTMPVCPAGGTYQVAWIVGGPTPKCSVHGDLLLEYDHIKTLRDAEEADLRTEAERKASTNESNKATPVMRP